MKKKCIMVLLIVIMLIGYASTETMKEKNEQVIIGAFGISNSDFKSFNTNYNGIINNEFLNLKDLNKISKNIIEDMDFKESYREVVEETKMSKLSIYGQVGKSKNVKDDYEKLADITSKISKILEKQKLNLKTNTCIIGSYEGQLESEYKMAVVKKIINLSNSRLVESLVNDDFLSYSLYTDNIDNYIYTGRNKINSNIAIRYDEYRDKTNIFIIFMARILSLLKWGRNCHLR